MKNKPKESNRVKTVKRLRLYLGWFGVLMPVFASGVLVGVGLSGGLSAMYVVQVVVVSAICYFVGRQLLKPVMARKKKVKSYG